MNFPWLAASTNHLMYRMTDAEFIAAMSEWLSTKQNKYAIESARICTKNRRDALTLNENMSLLQMMIDNASIA